MGLALPGEFPGFDSFSDDIRGTGHMPTIDGTAFRERAAHERRDTIIQEKIVPLMADLSLRQLIDVHNFIRGMNTIPEEDHA